MQFRNKKIEFSLGEERTQLLICIGISLLIWTFMKLSGEFSTTRHVHLEYRLPSMMEFSMPPPDQVVANVSGTGLSLIGKYLRNPHPKVVVDLTHNDWIIDRDELSAKVESALSIPLRNLNPSSLSLSLDSMATKKVPVVLDADIEFAPDFFQHGEVTLSNDSVVLSGTPTQLAEIHQVFTEKLAAPAATGDIRANLRLKLPEAAKIQLIPRTVDVFIPIEAFTEKTFTVPIEIPVSKDSIQLIPSEVQLKCVVSLSQYAQLRATDFSVEVAIRDDLELAPLNFVPVRLTNAPEWVRSVIITPPTVEFYIVN